jgi:prevent-host-death family protein
MTDISVSVHELKARLSEFLGRSVHGKERIIIKRRNHPIAMIVPLSESLKSEKGGLFSVNWSRFGDLAASLDEVYTLRQDEDYREVSI